jgi:hypothetical protein
MLPLKKKNNQYSALVLLISSSNIPVLVGRWFWSNCFTPIKPFGISLQMITSNLSVVKLPNFLG